MFGLATFADEIAGPGSRRAVESAKALVAALGAALLILDLVLRRAGHSAWLRRLREVALVLLAMVAGLAWWNFMQFHYLHYTHVSDTFHYYVGSKYFDELGHSRLYACTAIADAEAGTHTGVSGRLLRNLETNRLEPTTSTLADPDACKRHFDVPRWDMFTHDVGWFRDRVPRSRWHAIQRDHGYNPPPTWTALGGALAASAPASDAWILALGAIDPLLLCAMWAAIAWAFGWRALCVAAIFWGTNLFAGFGWTGGSFLRQAWLVASIGGICLLRRGRPASAGASLAVAASLRIFPAALLVGVALRGLWSLMSSERRGVAADHRRFTAGALAGAAAIVTVSLVAVGGFQPWLEFIDNSRTHLATPLKNHVGLQTVLAYDADHVDRLIQGGTAEDRYLEWRAARESRSAERVVGYWLLLTGFGILLAFAVRDQPDWVAATLGIGLIPVAFELTNYYYAILLGYGLLVVRWPGIGPALLGLSALGWVIVDRRQWQDEIMVWGSVFVLVFVCFCTLLPLYRAPQGSFSDESSAGL
ncbi:MAG: hypothetical protein JRE13_09050 [Deltaproteobacteria bacterium]|nr:hypothetical protein [Deltaproteobacteria bacterium]